MAQRQLGQPGALNTESIGVAPLMARQHRQTGRAGPGVWGQTCGAWGLARRAEPTRRAKKEIIIMIISVVRSSPRHTREFTRSPGLARRGQLILFDVVRIASWILGTSVPLKKGPSARGLQTVPHSKTGTRALLGPCAPAFRRCALRRRRRSRRRCCYTLSAACTRSALVRS